MGKFKSNTKAMEKLTNRYPKVSVPDDPLVALKPMDDGRSREPAIKIKKTGKQGSNIGAM